MGFERFLRECWLIVSLGFLFAGTGCDRSEANSIPDAKAIRVTVSDDLHSILKNAPPGATVFLRPGCYHLETPLAITKSVSLIGEDAETPEKAVLECDKDCVLTITSERVRIEALTVRASGVSLRIAVGISKGNVELRNCRITASDTKFDNGMGVVAVGKDARVALVDCEIFDCNYALASFVGARCQLDGCTIRDSFLGVTGFDQGMAALTRCRIHNNFEGVVATDGELTLSQCKVFHNSHGFAVRSKGRITASHCEVLRNSAYGVEIDGAGGVATLTECSLFENALGAVEVQDMGQGVFRDNYIWKNGEGYGGITWNLHASAGKVVREGNLERPPMTPVSSIARPPFELRKTIERASDGDVVKVPAGEYRLEGTVRIQKSITLVGGGENPEDVVLVCANGDAIEITQNARVSNLFIRALAGNAVRVTAGAPHFSKCWLTASSEKAGAAISGPESTPTFTECTFMCSYGGIVSSEKASPVFEQCYVHDNDYGTVLANGGTGVFTNCTVVGNEIGLGIYKEGQCECTDCRFIVNKGGINEGGAGARGKYVNCLFSNNYGYAVGVMENAQVDCEQCDIKGGGIAVSTEGQLRLKNCDVSENTRSGVSVTQRGHATLEDCIVHDNKHAGIYVGSGGNAMLTGCLISRNSRLGLLIDGSRSAATCDNCTMQGNLAGVGVGNEGKAVLNKCDIFENTDSGVEVASNGTATAANCSVFRNNTSGVIIHEKDGNGTFVKCSIHHNAKAGVAVDMQAQASFNDCEIYSNSSWGVLAKDGGTSTLRRCSIFDNKEEGIYLVDNGGGAFEDCEVFQNRLAGIKIRRGVTFERIPADSLTMRGERYEVPGQKPTFVRCVVRLNDEQGVDVDQLSRAEFRDCEICFNRRVRDLDELPDKVTYTNCKIHDNHYNSSLGLCVVLARKGALLLGADATETETHEGESTIEKIRGRASQGEAEAQYLLGLSHIDGLGMEVDHNKAVAWLRRAAKQDHPEAQLVLATLLSAYQGQGKEAAKWFDAFIEGGHTLPEQVVQFRKMEILNTLDSFDRRLLTKDQIKKALQAKPKRTPIGPSPSYPVGPGGPTASQAIAVLNGGRESSADDNVNRSINKMGLAYEGLAIAFLQTRIENEILPIIRYFYSPESEEYAVVRKRCSEALKQ